jgi:CubicO group peptidase (beta-lactamase class C family)
MRKILRMGPAGYVDATTDAPFGFHYSNEGYAVLGEILERISDPPDSFEGLLRKKLFIPLGIEKCRIISKEEALMEAGTLALREVVIRELDPLISPATGASCSLNDWMTFIRHIMNGVNGHPTSAAVLRKPESFAMLKEIQKNCFYGAGAVMLSQEPSAAYHFGANGIHSSLIWFELGQRETGAGVSFIVVSTEPFDEVSTAFYILAEAIQRKANPAKNPERRWIPASDVAPTVGKRD